MQPNMHSAFSRILEVNLKGRNGLEGNTLKITEELGEYFAEVNRILGRKPAKGKTKAEIVQDATNEGADVLIALFSSLQSMGVKLDDIIAGIYAGCAKWEAQMQRGEYGVPQQ